MSRNDPCTCGSGKRFKHCHGRFESTGPSALHRQALAAHMSGSLTQAEALYRRALESNSADADSLHMLGVVQFERLRYPEALELMWQASELTGWSDAVIRQNMGLVLAKLLAPHANARQKAFVAAYAASEAERTASPAIAARVSVVLPICTPSRFVARAIASVARQTYPDIEMIVVHDTGTDEVARVVAEAMSGAPFPFKVFSTGHRGEAEAANEGARRAEGRYLAFLGADEYFAANRIERMAAEMARATPLWGYSRVGTIGRAVGRAPRGISMTDSPAHDFRSNELASFTLLRRNAM